MCSSLTVLSGRVSVLLFTKLPRSIIYGDRSYLLVLFYVDVRQDLPGPSTTVSDQNK